MRIHSFVFGILLVCLTSLLEGQAPQGFFLKSWQPRVISNPEFVDVQQTTDPVTISIKINFNDTITKIPKYVFGDNANLWTGSMSDNKQLMKMVADRNIGVLRGPGGSISDVFFWNRNVNTQPPDVPQSMLPDLWYGNRPFPWGHGQWQLTHFIVFLDR